MPTKHRAIISLGILLAGLTYLPLISHAAKPTVRSAADNADVLRVPRQEVAGSVDRRAALAEDLDSNATDSSARWQAGYVRDGDGWRSYEADCLSAALQEKLDQYCERRAAASVTLAGRLELANWCRSHDLPDQEIAHLHEAQSLDSRGENTQLLERLGYRQVSGQWFSREQLLAWQDVNAQSNASLKQWGPKLERVVKQFSGNVRQQEAARNILKEIHDASAIPAIELILAGRSEPLALAAVETFAHIPGYEASIALTKQGVCSKWAKVREAAARELKSRPFDEFVPQVIELLATKITAKLEFVDEGFAPHRGRARLYYAFILARETDDQFQVSVHQTMDYTIGASLAGKVVRRVELGRYSPERYVLEAERVTAKKRMAESFLVVQRRVEELNERTEELNRRVGGLLATVSDKPQTDDVSKWWSWWQKQSDLELSGDKRIVRVDEFETLGSPAARAGFVSCFAAGTPVRTETGLVPIEQVGVGDRVLAKDVETGELTWKPVLQTTVRPPRELLTLRFDDETIVCTGGHRFWISGSGWTKARDLTAASLVHTAVGNTPVWTAKRGETAKTYNLVVADFHTYFVGQTGVLCQDLLPPKPTNKVVPGLDRSQIASK